MLRKLHDITHAFGMYRLKGQRVMAALGFTPAAFPRQMPQDLWQGKPALGRAILGGEFTFHGESFRITPESWRAVEQRDLAWQRELNQFAWLRDVAAFHDDMEEAGRIRRFIQEWWRGRQHQHPVGRHPDIAGERVAQWLCHRDFLLRGASPHFRRRFFKQLYTELLKLEQHRLRKQDTTSFTALKGLIFGALSLPSAPFLLLPALKTLEHAVALRFFADGGHISRSPEWHVEELKTLLEIRALLDYRKAADFQFLERALSKIIAALATVTHPDASLALFNDSTEISTREVMRLWQTWRKPQPKPASHLTQMGFVRLQQAASVLVMDVGLPNPALSRSFYGTLAFEFSNNEERIIVNCGAYRGGDSEWRRACKATGAHSTLSIDHANSWLTSDETQHSLVFQPEVRCHLDEQPESLMVDAAYNGYIPFAGMVHYRKLTLLAEGNCLQGVEVLTPHKAAAARDTHRVQIRFHLAPEITIHRISRGSIELKTASGQMWRFQSPKEFAAGVEESVYLGKQGRPIPTAQICIESLINGQSDVRIDWELRKL
jgi:uncharacterized heparinase superfamily protein